MAIDPYASCPCGSGKKFKWCCQDIHVDIDKAFQQHHDGQHEAALRQMAEVVQQHGGNPEVWGRQAQLLSLNGRLEDAEQALEKAFALNPNYAFGYMLRGMFRLQEGEQVGALMLLRKAAELYAPDAHDQLAYIHELIADIELKLNRPVAAHAALRRAVHLSPANSELRDAFSAVFGPESRLPESARKEYQFLAPTTPSDQWKQVVGMASTGRFTDALKAFTSWTEQHPEDRAGWYNRGLVQAWLGDNPAAVESLSRYVELEPDEARAGTTWTLVEVLRCGHGLEAEADYVEHRAVMMMSDARPIVQLLQVWQEARRLIGLRNDPQQGMLSALILDEVPSLVLSGAASPPAKLAAYLLITGNVLQLWHPKAESLDRVVTELRQKVGSAVGEPGRAVVPINFGDVTAEALLFPTAPTTELDAEAKMREHAQQYFEEMWVHQPLKSLGGVPPIDAAGHTNLRKRLRGVVTFLQECSTENSPRWYDFDRLRRKLGLTEAAAAAPPAVGASADVSSMGAAELAALDPNSLSDSQLEQAFRTAQQLDARELASRFAKTLIARPAQAGSADRYPFFQHLIQEVQSSNDLDAALAYVDAGEKADCEANEGRRRNEYELRRGRLLAKRGNAPQARDVFDRLIARVPGELQVAGAAAEAMLGAKQAKDALKFAEHGLSQARAQNHRDSEGYFLELIGAAKKQGA
jgi:tetratricopeptide (TPR) repeat protein